MTSKHRTRVPKYRLHKPSGQAVVTIRGRDIYLGRHGTETSKAEYRRLAAEFFSGAPVNAPSRGMSRSDLTVSKLVEDYLGYLRVSRSQSWLDNNLDKLSLSAEPLDRIYGHTEASSFGPKSLKVTGSGGYGA